MTDAEIIKALKCHNQSRVDCKECPYYRTGEDCLDRLLTNAINLITTQKAEIEGLKKDCKLEIHLDEAFQKECEYETKQAGSEAVKKFAEALKAEMKNLSKVHLFGREFALVGDTFVDSFMEKYEGENNDI